MSKCRAHFGERFFRVRDEPDVRDLCSRREYVHEFSKRFAPVERMEDAFRLLQKTAPEEYSMGAADDVFWARVRVAGVIGEARESSQARALTFAIARAIGVEPEVNG